MASRPRKSITWTTVAVTIAAALASALMLAVNGAGSLGRLGSEGRHAASFGAKKSPLDSKGPGTSAGTDAGRDDQNRRGQLHP